MLALCHKIQGAPLPGCCLFQGTKLRGRQCRGRARCRRCRCYPHARRRQERGSLQARPAPSCGHEEGVGGWCSTEKPGGKRVQVPVGPSPVLTGSLLAALHTPHQDSSSRMMSLGQFQEARDSGAAGRRCIFARAPGPAAAVLRRSGLEVTSADSSRPPLLQNGQSVRTAAGLASAHSRLPHVAGAGQRRQRVAPPSELRRRAHMAIIWQVPRGRLHSLCSSEYDG